ncbi:HAD family hydrolase [Cryobacterium sandaracinum]|uniref:HAD family hydrolase n=1 Tax=Cryobacterium sandaracinum TaxID=1259247 RepID=A0ABY2JKS9_9MICO|nr:HAD family hydrolase [Cryobacterium sandaracinum]TFD05788.1 HAD family hydrolase [Cryobacterium sandaracinum]
MSAPAPAVVLFDLDDTLFAHRGAMADGIRAYLGSLGGTFTDADPGAALALWDDLEERHYHAYLAGSLDFAGQRRERARDFAAAHGVTLTGPAATSWFDAYFLHYRASWRLHTDALPCLDALAVAFPGVRIGLITNGESTPQGHKLADTGLDVRLEHVIASGSLGFAKPDPRIFRHACMVFGSESEQTVYVGDRLRTDAIGAAAAGLTGVWLDRTAAGAGGGAGGSGAGAGADAAEAARLGIIRITSLAALPGALAARSLAPLTAGPR